MSLGPGLRWALGMSLVGSAVAVLSPTESTVGARASASESLPGNAPTTGPAGLASTTSAVPAPLPSNLTPIALEAATFDPFIGVLPPAPPPAPVAAVAPASVSPPPAPPPMTYRFLGRMVDPSGRQQIYLSHGETSVVAAVGTSLDDGYVIDAIGDDSVALHHLSAGTHVLLSIPPAGDGAFR